MENMTGLTELLLRIFCTSASMLFLFEETASCANVEIQAIEMINVNIDLIKWRLMVTARPSLGGVKLLFRPVAGDR